MQNAGIKLWRVQRAQKTGLCVGLDPHFDADGELNQKFYEGYVTPHTAELKGYFFSVGAKDHAAFLAGLTSYFFDIIDIAWREGIRVFKPQIAFYERFSPYGMFVLSLLCRNLHERAQSAKEEIFLILDAKRGDIETTQLPYYETYLTDLGKEVAGGLKGIFGFDAMTVTTWMGEDVVSPGLPFFKEGKSAIVVTRSSNASGTTLQDARLQANADTVLSEKQEPFRVDEKILEELRALLGVAPTAHEYMLYETEKLSEKNNLNENSISPLFSVMGSTTLMTDSFRKIRPQGIALVPGFGAQGGTFGNVAPLMIKEGPLAGHVGILSSSREFNFPWMVQAGGAGDPRELESEFRRVLEKFKKEEKHMYEVEGYPYPFN